jgi:hypothetical protein
MTETVVAATIFGILLWLEWRYRHRSVRVGTVMLALVVWWFTQPSITVAARRASALAPEARSMELRGEPLSEYMIGVETMRRFLVEQYQADSDVRLIVLGVLVWLSCSPVFRRHAAPNQITPAA